MFSEHLVWLV
jgi:hypothetical protein